MLHIGSRDEPIKSITLTRSKIWLAYSSKVISLNIYNLESDTSIVLEPDQEER